MVTDEEPATSWFYDLLSDAKLTARWARRWQGWNERLDLWLLPRLRPLEIQEEESRPVRVAVYVVGGLVVIGLLYLTWLAGQLLAATPASQWREIIVGLFATLLRVGIALVIALLWTIPLGVAIGTNRRLARWLQPVVQVVASVPATALFPAFLLIFLDLPGGLNLASVVLMLAGTQWYLLFNIIAGAGAIPQDLKYTAALLHLDRRARWRTLILPALFPYIVTGAITATGGAWNASIVAEYVQFEGQTLFVTGIGAVIANATAAGDYSLLLAATLSMILAVVAINRLLWRRLYLLAEERFRME
jgi:NitT/TauT family transport system permease protein